MLSLKPLDVGIGLAFLFLGLTFMASALVELLSTVRNWRAQMLHEASAKMLEGSNVLSVDQVYKNPMVAVLGRESGKSPFDVLEHFGWRIAGTAASQPSYIPASVFSAVILQRLAQLSASDLTPDGTATALRKMMTVTNGQTTALPEGLRSVLLTALIAQGDSIQGIRLGIEKWFNDTMDRASGWYKRRTQTALLAVGLAMALFGNVDSIGVARWLWQGDAARDAVVKAAQHYVETNAKQVEPPAPPKDEAAPATEPTDLKSLGAKVIDIDNQLVALHYPLGWPPVDPGPIWLLQYLIGCAITAVAVSMGSSFWFDALQNLLKLRGTGPKPGPR